MLTTVTGRFYWSDLTNRWEPNLEKPPSDCELAVLRYFNPDINGRSEWVDVDELIDALPECKDLGGHNGSSMFTRRIAKDFLCTPDHAKERQGSRVIARRFVGLTKSREEKYPIRSDIRSEIKKLPCAALGSKAQIEVDHKDGRKDDPRVNKLNLQQLSDFQPLHKTANNVKRSCCQKCRKTNRRFNAELLGFTTGWTEGGEQYEGTCVGCYWYSPIEFRSRFILEVE